MPIRAECSCGKVYRVKDDLAGKRFRCGSCDRAVPVPPPDEEPLEVVSLAVDEEETQPRQRGRASGADARPARRGVTSHSQNEDEAPRPRRRSRTEDDEREDVAEPERPRRKKKKRSAAGSGDSGGSGATLGATLGGLLAMVGAAVWFVVGLMNNYIFFYPPVLFLLGLISFVKGLMGQD